MSNNYGAVCTEVLNVLNKLPKNQLALIPHNIIEDLKSHSRSYDKDIKLKFDKLGNPILSKEAKSMIIMLYQKYFLDDRIRELLLKKLVKNDNEKQMKLKKSIKNDIFSD